MAARAVPPRSVERLHQTHVGPWPPVGVLPDHDPQGSRHRDRGYSDANGTAWWPRGEPEEPRVVGGQEQLRAPPGADLPVGRKHSRPQWLRNHV